MLCYAEAVGNRLIAMTLESCFNKWKWHCEIYKRLCQDWEGDKATQYITSQVFFSILALNTREAILLNKEVFDEGETLDFFVCTLIFWTVQLFLLAHLSLWSLFILLSLNAFLKVAPTTGCIFLQSQLGNWNWKLQQGGFLFFPPPLATKDSMPTLPGLSIIKHYSLLLQLISLLLI